ncbi:MAG: SAM-dependent DNA methyltransferase, partial [Myxococcales bacterium]|nr:SAM-dependent DNA methyltransferase [Myxococcales bacterium]
VIAIMNMILHGIEAPNILHVNTLTENLADIQDKDRYDVILANPPWERIKLQEKEYFAARSAAVERGVAPAERRRRIAALARDDPATYQAYLRALRASSGVLRFLRASGRYPLTAHGDINTYSIFAELARALLTEDGLAGLIVPTGIATDDTNKRFFRRLMGEGSLVSLFDFENRDALFPGVDTRMRFCLLTFGRARQQAAPVFSFFARDVRDLRDEQRSFTLTADDIRAMNPIRQTCPVFRTRRDARVAAALCRAAPPLRAPGERAGAGASRWPVQITTIFHMTHDSSLFRPRPAGADWRPVLEGKMIGMYDHRAADIIVNPRNLHRPQQPQAVRGAQRLSPAFTPRPYLWAPSSVVEGRRPSGWSRAWALVVKRVSAATNERTVVGAFVPMHALSYTLYVITAPAPAGDFVGLAANLLSYVYDYCVRQKTTQSSITIGVLREAPIIPRDRYEQSVAWGPAGLSLIDWIRPRVLELSYTAWDLVAFARDQGYEGPPFRWDDERRFWLRAELDAAYFHLYGLHEDDVAHVMDSFELARKRDQRAHGVYRTKAAILDIYRRMAKAAATGEPYEAAIDPAPADPRAAHPARSAEEVAGVAATLHRALVERDVADARDESSARARGRRRSSDRSSASGDRGSDAAPPSGPDRTAPPGGD